MQSRPGFAAPFRSLDEHRPRRFQRILKLNIAQSREISFLTHNASFALLIYGKFPSLAPFYSRVWRHFTPEFGGFRSARLVCAICEYMKKGHVCKVVFGLGGVLSDFCRENFTK
jgi:ABC-type taurine transport system ATPase subunit